MMRHRFCLGMQYRVVYKVFEFSSTRSPQNDPGDQEFVGAHIGADVIDGPEPARGCGYCLLQDRLVAHVAGDYILRASIDGHGRLLRMVNQRPDNLSPSAERPDHSLTCLAGSTRDQNHGNLNPVPGRFLFLIRSQPIIQKVPGTPTLLPQS